MESSAFFWGTMACVAVNTIIAATEHYNQPQELGKAQCKIISILLLMSKPRRWRSGLDRSLRKVGYLNPSRNRP